MGPIRGALLHVIVGTCCTTGCFESHTLDGSPSASRDASVDAEAPFDAGPVSSCPLDHLDWCVSLPRQLDLVLVVDNSNDVSAEQSMLAERLPPFLRALTTGDVDEDGRPDRPPFDSIQIGVLSTDLGSAGHPWPNCDGVGDDGLLQTDADGTSFECRSTYDRIHLLEAPEDMGRVAREVGCMLRDSSGCAWEQPLESALHGLTPSSCPPAFTRGVGHGDGFNAGMVRPHSVLGVLVLSTEDDCSFEDESLADPSGAIPPNLRCALTPDALYPVSRYVEGLLALRRGHAQRLVFGVMAGIPPELVPDRDPIDAEAILAHPRMQARPAPADPTRLAPACTSPDAGDSYPARRLVELTDGLAARGAGAALISICDPDLGPFLDEIIESADAPAPPCE